MLHDAPVPAPPPPTVAGARFALGAPVRCEDGPVGVLSRIVVDPLLRRVTHLVVEPRRRHALARLVPVGLAAVRADGVLLTCTREVFHALRFAEETDFLPPGDPWLTLGYAGVGVGLPEAAVASPAAGVLMWPYHALAPTMVRHERIPLGEVEVRRGRPVLCDDGPVGRVQGLIVTPDGGHVTHVVLQEGHAWARKQVAIPVGAITRIDADGVTVAMSGDAIGSLPGLG